MRTRIRCYRHVMTCELVEIGVREFCSETARIACHHCGIYAGKAGSFHIVVGHCALSCIQGRVPDGRYFVVQDIVIPCQCEAIIAMNVFCGGRKAVARFCFQVFITIYIEYICHIEIHVHLFQSRRSEASGIRPAHFQVVQRIHSRYFRCQLPPITREVIAA